MMNRKNVLGAIALLACFCAKASASAVGDTIVVEDAKKVRIETRDTVQRIVISGSKEDPEFHYVQRISIPDTNAVRRNLTSVKDFNKISLPGKDGKPSQWSVSGHIFFGLDALLNPPDEYGFKLFPSFNFGARILADWRPYGKKNVWSAGIGAAAHIYGMKDKNYLTKVGDMLTPVAFPPEQTDHSSSLLVTSIEVPIMYTHYFDSKAKWGISLGGIVNFNVSATASRTYEYQGEDYNVTAKSIGQNVVTLDALAIIHIPSCPDIYCTYSPTKLFKDGRGPKANQLSFGIYW